jgi:hypothetical protein
VRASKAPNCCYCFLHSTSNLRPSRKLTPMSVLASLSDGATLIDVYRAHPPVAAAALVLVDAGGRTLPSMPLHKIGSHFLFACVFEVDCQFVAVDRGDGAVAELLVEDAFAQFEIGLDDGGGDEFAFDGFW